MGNCMSSLEHFDENCQMRSGDEWDDQYEKCSSPMLTLKDDLGQALGAHKDKFLALPESSLGASGVEKGMDIKDLWRLVHRDIEMEYLADSQNTSAGCLRDQVAKEIKSLKSQLERSQAALHALETRTLPLEHGGPDNDHDKTNNNLKGGSSPLVEALHLVDFEAFGPARTKPRQVQETHSAEGLLDQDLGYGDTNISDHHFDSSSCPHLLDDDSRLVNCATQTDYRKGRTYQRGTKRGRAPHVGASKYAVVNSSTGSSTSGVDVGSVSSRSDIVHTSLPVRKSVHIIESTLDSPSSADDVENPLVRLRTPSFKRAIERGTSGESSNVSFDTTEAVSTSSDLSPDRSDLVPPLPPSYQEHLALHGHKSSHSGRQVSPRTSRARAPTGYRHYSPHITKRDKTTRTQCLSSSKDSDHSTSPSALKRENCQNVSSVSFDSTKQDYDDDDDVLYDGDLVKDNKESEGKALEDGESAHSRRLSTLVEESDQEMTDDYHNSYLRGHRGLHRGMGASTRGQLVEVPSRFLRGTSPPPPQYKQPPAYKDAVIPSGSREQSPAATQRFSVNTRVSSKSRSLSPPYLTPRPTSPNRRRNNRVYPEQPQHGDYGPDTDYGDSSNSLDAKASLSGSQKAQLEFRGSTSSEIRPNHHVPESEPSKAASQSVVSSPDDSKQKAPGEAQLSSVGRARRKSLQDMRQQQSSNRLEIKRESDISGSADKVKDENVSSPLSKTGGKTARPRLGSSDVPKTQSIDECTTEDDVFTVKSCSTDPGPKESGSHQSDPEQAKQEAREKRAPVAADIVNADSAPDSSLGGAAMAGKQQLTRSSAGTSGVTLAGAAQKVTKQIIPDTPSPVKVPEHVPLIAAASAQKDNVFPSLPDTFLKDLGLVHTGSKNDNYNAEQSPEQEIEEKFASLALAFRTDRITLEKRVELHQRARDIAEQNINREIHGIQDTLQLLERFCMDAPSRDVYDKVQRHIDVLRESTVRMSSRAEILGAVQQECRISLALDVMLQHVENLKLTLDKERAELEETKKLLHDNSQTVSVDGERRSLSISGGLISAKSSQDDPNYQAINTAQSSTRLKRRISRRQASSGQYGGSSEGGANSSHTTQPEH